MFEPGDRVKFTGWIEDDFGTVEEVDGDTIIVRMDEIVAIDPPIYKFPAELLEKLDGKNSH